MKAVSFVVCALLSSQASAQTTRADVLSRLDALEARVEVLEQERDKATDAPEVERPQDAGEAPRVVCAIDGLVLTISPPDAGGWVEERAAPPSFGAWRFAVERRVFGDLLVVATWEQFAGIDATRVTVAVANAFADTGAVVFRNLTVDAGSERLIDTTESVSPGIDAVQVRGILARRASVGREAARLDGYEQIEPTKGYPSWTASVAEQGRRDALLGAKRLGPYALGDPVVHGPSSLDGSHGGWSVAPWHFGPEGWQRSSRAGYRWAEASMFLTLDRSPLAAFDRESLLPTNPHSPYWAGRASVVLPGWRADPSPACPYLPELESYEAHAYSHLHRQTAAAAMLAPRDAFARWLLVEVYWHDLTLWLDGKRPDYPNELLKPLVAVIEDTPAHIGWSNGGRGLAHTVNAYVFARPYFSPKRRDAPAGYLPDQLSSGETYSELLPKLLRHLARRNGIIHSFGPDPSYPTVTVAARAREVDLMYPALISLGLDDVAAVTKKTMARVDGMSPAASFDPSAGLSWASGKYEEPSYYPPYDWIRGVGVESFDATVPWYSPTEQGLSMVPPAMLGIESKSQRE